jgi:hypothetical protein
LNSAASITLSDLRPAFTMTWSLSIETTSAVITSPERISWRAKLSSKSAAKDSIEDGVDLEVEAIKIKLPKKLLKVMFLIQKMIIKIKCQMK